MSELMDDGIIRMPYEMAMSDELSRKQFYSRANSLLTELTEIRAKLAAMESQEPLCHLFGSNLKEVTSDLKRAESYLPIRASKTKPKEYKAVIPVYAKPVPADKPSRITEQDAREIAISVMRYCHENPNWYPDAWREDRGRELLNKLNAYRQVPVVAVPDEWRRIVERAANIMRMSGAVSNKDSLNPLHSWLHDVESLLSAPSHSQQSAAFTLVDLNIIRQWYNCVSDCNPSYLQAEGFDDKATYEKVLNAIDRCPSHESEGE